MDYNFTVDYTSQAKDDLSSIINYIKNTLCNETAAKDFYKNLKDSIETIRLFPQSCSKVNNKYITCGEIRKLLIDDYIAFYKVEETQITILRILYGMQNYNEIL